LLDLICAICGEFLSEIIVRTDAPAEACGMRKILNLALWVGAIVFVGSVSGAIAGGLLGYFVGWLACLHRSCLWVRPMAIFLGAVAGAFGVPGILTLMWLERSSKGSS
jgi:uncharacterized membrane protein